MRITRRRFLAAFGAGAAACAGTVAYAVWIEPTWLRTYEVEIPLAIPEAFDGYVIAQLSDFHVGGGIPTDLIREAVRRVVAAKPDLVALTGDFIQGPSAGSCAEEVGDLLAGLRAGDGVLAVLGNHDAGVYNPRRHRPVQERIDLVTGELERAGARVLENEIVTVSRGGSSMNVLGLGDLWCDRFDPSGIVPGTPETPTIALSHNPDTAPDLSRRGCGLILCGHTHGGQVSFPLVGPPMLPVQRRDLAAGLYRLGQDTLASEDEGSAWVYVNRGLGWLRRIRFRVRPEVTVIRLKAVQGEPS